MYWRVREESLERESGPGPRTSETPDPRPFEKNIFYAKIHFISQKLKKKILEGAVAKYENSFFKITAQKYPNKTILLIV